MPFKPGVNPNPNRHIPDPDIPPPAKKYQQKKSVINRLLSIALNIAENESIGEAQRLAAVKIGSELWSKRPAPRRKSEKEKLLISALQGSKPKKKAPAEAGA